MLLETVNFHNPLVHLKEFEYRATNPMYVNRVLTINGTWIGPSKAKVWCVDDEGAVGMVGLVTTAE
jgi:hydroxyacyl-ACP dehydratase HTD2-like protein with hotdog domain